MLQVIWFYLLYHRDDNSLQIVSRQKKSHCPPSSLSEFNGDEEDCFRSLPRPYLSIHQEELEKVSHQQQWQVASIRIRYKFHLRQHQVFFVIQRESDLAYKYVWTESQNIVQ